MATKSLNARMAQKIDTNANWALATSFVPLKGEICVYSDLNKFKIGDGSTVIGSLPFIGSEFEESSNKVTSISSSSTDVQYPSAKCVYDAISALPKSMIFKGTLGTNGTITDLPTAAADNKGFTYKVITAGTYASQVAKVGDVFVCGDPIEGTYEWILIPAGDVDTDTWRGIKVNDTILLGNGITTGDINFKSGANVTLTGSGNDLTIAATDTVYTHPAGSGASKTSGLYKFSTDATSHISEVTAVTKADITGLGIPESDTNTTYTFAEGSTNGAFSVTPSEGSAQSVPIHGLGSAAYTESSAYAASSHNQAASTITAGTLAGQVNANATSVQTLGISQVRNIYAGTTDMEEGVTALATGDIYVVYEV